MKVFNDNNVDNVKKCQYVKHIKLHKTRTGKSKEYINKLTNVGCPLGRKKSKGCGCSLLNSKKSLNVKKRGRQNKKQRILL